MNTCPPASTPSRASFLALTLGSFLLGCSSGSRPAGPGDAGGGGGGDGNGDGDDVGAIDAAPGPAADAAVSVADAGLTVAACLEADFPTPPDLGPDYDQFHPTIGSHCRGTDHQDITGVERVVFIGDSITVGSPPTTTGDYYRTRLARDLADRFGLPHPSATWELVNVLEGRTVVRTSGAFSSCAKWGARSDDLIQDSSQIEDCFPLAERGKRTLVIMTIGGNDVAELTKDGLDGVPVAEVRAQAEAFVQLTRDAVRWFTDDPTKFPAGVFVVFSNLYEFTDAMADPTVCPAAGVAGFSGQWADPAALADLVIWINEQYLSIAVETGTDMIFALEAFCGHGFNHGDPASPCYRGPGAARWFDDTCIHPNATGHAELAGMFLDVVEE